MENKEVSLEEATTESTVEDTNLDSKPQEEAPKTDASSEKKENKILSFFITTLNGMAYGLFATLIVGTIIATIGNFFKDGAATNEFCKFVYQMISGKYSAGEDVLFVRDCLRKKCKIYAVPDTLASLNDERDSSWFKGYNEKYFFDKGVFLKIAHPKLCSLFALYLVIKHKEYRSERNSNIRKIYRLIKKGIRSVK